MEEQEKKPAYIEWIKSFFGPLIVIIGFIYKFGAKDAELDLRVSQLEKHDLINGARIDALVERQLEEKEKVWTSIYEIRIMLQDKQNRLK